MLNQTKLIVTNKQIENKDRTCSYHKGLLKVCDKEPIGKLEGADKERCSLRMQSSTTLKVDSITLSLKTRVL